jgi:hypothetical protein
MQIFKLAGNGVQIVLSVPTEFGGETQPPSLEITIDDSFDFPAGTYQLSEFQSNVVVVGSLGLFDQEPSEAGGTMRLLDPHGVQTQLLSVRLFFYSQVGNQDFESDTTGMLVCVSSIPNSSAPSAWHAEKLTGTVSYTIPAGVDVGPG